MREARKQVSRNASLMQTGLSQTENVRRVSPDVLFYAAKTYLVSLLGDAVNSFGLAIGLTARLTKVGAPAAAP